MKDVYSSHVNQIGHDTETGELHVIWDTGKHSIYDGVAPHTAEHVMNNWSVGKALHEQIKPNHPHRYAE